MVVYHFLIFDETQIIFTQCNYKYDCSYTFKTMDPLLAL